jgi:hypothetical protein
MTEMPDEYAQQLQTLVRDWGMLGVLRELARICGHWSRHYNPSAATRSYAVAEVQLRSVADYLESVSNPS